MNDTRPTFDLLDEPWISCLLADGSSVELSLRQVLARAGEIRSLAGDLAVMNFALLRLLLAVLHGAFKSELDDPESWAELREEGVSSERIDRYLEGFRNRFDLLHPQTPFFQVAGLHTAKGEFSGLEKLILDVPNGSPYLTMRGGAGLERLSFAEAARWVVTCQAFDISGIKSGAVGDARVKGGKGYPIGVGWAGRLGGLFVEGTTLEETLWLNLVGSSAASDLDWEADVPIWERPAQGPAEDRSAHAVGPASMYTWQARRMLLKHNGNVVTGVLISNGDRLEQHNRHLAEPLTRWRRSEPQQKKLKLDVVYMPLTHDPTRALWRGVAAALPRGGGRGKSADTASLASLGMEWLGALRSDAVLPLDHPVRLRAVGLEYGPQDSAITEQIDDSLMIELTTLASTDPQLRLDLERAIQVTEEGVGALRDLARNLARAENRDPQGSVQVASRGAYAELERDFRAWLLTLPPESTSTALSDWKAVAHRTIAGRSREMLSNVSPAAWAGRETSGRIVNAPLAEAWFRAALRKALGTPRTPTPPDGSSGEGPDGKHSEAAA